MREAVDAVVAFALYLLSESAYIYSFWTNKFRWLFGLIADMGICSCTIEARLSAGAAIRLCFSGCSAFVFSTLLPE